MHKLEVISPPNVYQGPLEPSRKPAEDSMDPNDVKSASGALAQLGPSHQPAEDSLGSNDVKVSRLAQLGPSHRQAENSMDPIGIGLSNGDLAQVALNRSPAVNGMGPDDSKVSVVVQSGPSPSGAQPKASQWGPSPSGAQPKASYRALFMSATGGLVQVEPSQGPAEDSMAPSDVEVMVVFNWGLAQVALSQGSAWTLTKSTLVRHWGPVRI
eukprot:gene25592-11245_t